VNVQFIPSMSVIAPDPSESRKLYIDALGLPHPGLDACVSGRERMSCAAGVYPATDRGRVPVVFRERRRCARDLRPPRVNPD